MGESAYITFVGSWCLLPYFCIIMPSHNTNACCKVLHEWNAYYRWQPSPSDTNMMKFWKACLFRTTSMSGYSQANTPLNEATFPTLFEITIDYLPIQATLVPSKHIYSFSSETNTKKCNQIHPVLIEALQLLKCALKKKCLDFMQGWLIAESLLCKDDPMLLICCWYYSEAWRGTWKM